MVAREPGIANDCVGIDIHEATGFAHSIAFDDMFDDRHDFVFGQARVEEDRSSVFRKTLFTDFALQKSSIIGSVGIADADIFSTANAVLETLFILTAKLLQIIHNCSP
jgi:hypothetical protein